MSSNITIQKICEVCGKEFTAKTTVTKCCSHKCSSKAYKERQKDAKIENANIATLRIRNKPLEAIKAKEFLTVRDVATILGYSRHTVYRLLKDGKIECINPGTRMIRIKRSAIDNFISRPIPVRPEATPVEYDMSECYTMGEAIRKYSISGSTLSDIIKRNNIPKLQKGRYVYVPKELIDKIFS